jgi:hypothetical protein
MVFPTQSKKITLQEKKNKFKFNTTEKTAELETPKHNASSLEVVHCNFKVGPWIVLMGSEVSS